MSRVTARGIERKDLNSKQIKEGTKQNKKNKFKNHFLKGGESTHRNNKTKKNNVA